MGGKASSRPPRALVTGATGLIGSATVAYLRDQGSHVTSLSLDGPSPPEADRSVVGDAASRDDVLDALTDVEVVVHLAAIAHPSLAPAYDVFRTNVTATFNVLDAAGQRGIKRAVVASSINASGVPFNRHAPLPAYFPLDEDLPTDIADPYSLSKLCDELTGAMMARQFDDLSVVALRFPLVKAMADLKTVSEQQAANPALGVREGWSYLDKRDAARSIWASLTADLEGAHIIGLSAADTLVDRPTMALLREFAPGVPVRRPLTGNQSAVSTDKARRLLGFEPIYSVHDHVRP